uniref:ATP synthase CF1 delta subunit n=1 Tax=Pachymeniopsis lanceolata TaxID=151733 RepID=UPI002A825D95|nr:ATP synthase CF1 delta subunit [Pachymeniopsis lanceolata]WOL37318.1 ATP synthase CF1 delta subunit [Pachymeniopsis lanceolata]
MSSQSVSKIALPYAEALLESVQEANLVEQTNQDLSLISTILLESIDLKSFLSNPLIVSIAKKNVLNELLGSQVNDYVLKFLLVLIDRRRISLLNVIIEKYLELAYNLESTIIAEISTAIMLTESQQQALIEKLKNITQSKNVKLVVQVNPSLIAGFIVQIGSKVIDTSLSGKLKQMSYYLNSI